MTALENQINTVENNEQFKIAVENQQEDLSQEALREWLEEQNTSFKQEAIIELGKTNEYAKNDDYVLEKIKQDTNVEAELALINTEMEVAIAEAKTESLNLENGKQVEEKVYTVEDDPQFKDLTQKEALNYLQTYHKEFIDKEYIAVNDEGKLVYKNGDTSLPMNNIGGRLLDGRGLNEFREDIKKKFIEENPDAEAELRGIPLEEVMAERKVKAINEIKSAMEDTKHVRSLVRGEKLGGYVEEQLIKKYTESGLLSEEDIKNLQKGTEHSSVEKKVSILETPEEKILEQFKKVGIEGELLTILNNPHFKEAIVFPKTISDEKLVRLYRGVSSLNESLTNQVSPALRTDIKEHEVTVIDSLREKVQELAENPSYENLLSYAESVNPELTKDEQKKLQEDMSHIEGMVLDGGISFKEALVRNHISYSGGNPGTGLSPYISSSKNPLEAMGFASEALLILDVPVSKLESLGENSSEVNIKAILSPEYIRAILPILIKEEDITQEDLENALKEINKKIPIEHTEVPVVSEEEIVKEKEQAQKDKLAVEEKRKNNLLKSFAEIPIPSELIQKIALELKVNTYEATKVALFDSLNERFKKISPNFPIEEYGFQEQTGAGESKKYDRKKITDTMLLKMKEFIVRMEQRIT